MRGRSAAVAVVVGVPLRVVRGVYAGRHTRNGNRTRSPFEFSNVPSNELLPSSKVEKYGSGVDV